MKEALRAVFEAALIPPFVFFFVGFCIYLAKEIIEIHETEVASN